MDYYEILPKGMDAYLSHHGHHFSKAMYVWAVGKMEDRNGGKVPIAERQRLDEFFKNSNIKLKRDDGYYDAVYVWCMAKADYYGSSIEDEKHLAKFVADYIDDPDGNPTRAFDEFMANCMAKGIDIPWEDMI